MTDDVKTAQVAIVRNQLFKINLAADRIERHMKEPMATEATCLACASDAKKIGEWSMDVAERLSVLLNQPTKAEIDAAKAQAEKERAG